MQEIKLEGGGTIKVMTVDNSPADLTVGMSMGES